ncbi:hypothetical protein E2562_013176 [Oryza meyeriana var. granulata]|uniref:DNA topoisomerase (ATP-hydrolyzing) n=1 Tax=Oryza meyeriana var. granulata TaxID=110450 RepID=A0A6G1DKG3_9ORYZ|nr:hypothetical protein E2562_013176 [Oryza meyeriana var. granulata]
MTHLEDDIVALMRRVIDMLGILRKEIKVELDGHVLPDYCFPDYVDLYLQFASRERSQNVPRVYQKLNWSWEGLGTNTFEKGRQYFKDIAIDQRHFIWVDEEDDKAIEIAFSNKQVEERKE